MDDVGAEEFDLTDLDGNGEGDGDSFASTADGDTFVGAGGPVRVQPMLPAISGRLEGVQDAIVTFGLRLDGLMASFDAMRTVLSDRLTEHIDGVTRVAQGNATDIEENRRSTERLVTDLRRATAANEETLRRIGVSLEELVVTADTEVELLRSAGAEPRDTKAIADLRKATKANAETLQQMTVVLEELVGHADTVMELLRSGTGPREAAVDVQIDGGLQTALEKIGDPLLGRLEEFEPAVDALREEMTQLRRRIGLRGKGSPSIGDDEIDRIADAVAVRLEVPPAVLDVKQLDEIVDTIVDRLQRVLEVVDDEPEVVPAKPRRPRSSRST